MPVHSKYMQFSAGHFSFMAHNFTSGIVVPMVNTPEEAQAVVASAKFPPMGLRGQGSAFPAIGLGIDIPEYIKAANETLITCIQIESRQGVENVDAICAVEGVGT